jgi:hypothetical protein
MSFTAIALWWITIDPFFERPFLGKADDQNV